MLSSMSMVLDPEKMVNWVSPRKWKLFAVQGGTVMKARLTVMKMEGREVKSKF